MFLFFKENLFQTILILILLIILAYVTNITSIPNSIILFQNQELNLQTIAGIKLEESIPVGISVQGDSQTSNLKQLTSKKQTKTYNLSLLGFNLKTIKANIIEDRKIIPLGNLVGLKLYTQGVLVVGMSQIEGEDNKIYKPYEEAGIEQGDSIIKINDEQIENTKELLSCVSKCKGKTMNITYLKEGVEIQKTITPVKTSKNTYKLGLWVRDAAAGVGTLSFYDTQTNSVASLGHSIQDIDTEEVVEISTGDFVTAEIINVQKGEKQNPGRIEGSIDDCIDIGVIYSNTKFGVYGYIKNKKLLNIDESRAIGIALRNQIKEGDATIICTLEDGKQEEYKVKIVKTFKNNNENNKSMIVKVTDERLLEKTGGIIQGMSGSPIIQNGKFIGALTHVLVSDPTTGYGVFADLMLNELKAIN